MTIFKPFAKVLSSGSGKLMLRGASGAGAVLRKSSV
jgi:hypothetical protein